MKEFHPGQANAVVLAGMCTGVAVVLSFLGMVFAPLAGLISFMVPIPIISVALMAGVQWSVIAFIGTMILDSIFFGVASYGFLIGMFGFLGVIFGACYRRRIPALMTLAIGALGMCAAAWLQSWILLKFMGIDFSIFSTNYVDWIVNQFNGAIDTMSSEEERASLHAMFDPVMAEIPKVFVSGIVLAMFCLSWITMMMSKYVFERIGIKGIPHLPEFSRWEMPTFLAYVFIIAFALSWLYDQGHLGTFQDHGWIEVVKLNVFALCEFFFCIQGLSVIWWMPVRYPAFKTYRWLIIAAIVFMPGIMLLALVEVGLFDMLFRYRKRHNYQ